MTSELYKERIVNEGRIEPTNENIVNLRARIHVLEVKYDLILNELKYYRQLVERLERKDDDSKPRL